MTKAELRKVYLEKQKSLAPDERNGKSRSIADFFFQNFDLSEVKNLHCFLPIEKFNEIDTPLIFERLWREFTHIATLVPRVDFQAGEITNLKFMPENDLVSNRWGIHEPVHNEQVAAVEIDLVLVPLLAFDRRGYRVGYGKGYYDKFLKACRADCRKIGLSYFTPVAKIADVQDYDVPLDFCVTPEGVVNCK